MLSFSVGHDISDRFAFHKTKIFTDVVRSSRSKWFEFMRKSSSVFALPSHWNSWVAHISPMNAQRLSHFVSSSWKLSGATRELIRSIGIADLLRTLSQRSGSLRVHAYSAILLTHLCMPGFIVHCLISLFILPFVDIIWTQRTFMHPILPPSGWRSFTQ